MKKGHPGIPVLIASALYALACRLWPAFARTALEGLSLPVMARLHRLTARLPFSVAELIALGLCAALPVTLAAALLRALVRRDAGALSGWLARAAGAAVTLGCALALLWVPARALPAQAVPAPEDARLAELCGALIEELNASELRFPEAAEALWLAPRAAGAADCAVKAARYPEWMRAARISGLFVPLTGEALADASAPAPLTPFTAVHELMHLAGIADEGAANIAAWERCMRAGDAFADSARLWALRYALGLLRHRDEAAWRRQRAKMEGAFERVFLECGGEAFAGRAALWPGLTPCRGDYADLVGYLAMKGNAP